MSATGKILWTGLAVIDANGRAQLWNGGQTPKLYRSEEQGRYACTDGSTLEEVTIVRGRLSECAGNVLVEGDPAMVAAFQQRLAEALHRAPTLRPAPPAGTTVLTSADLAKTGAWGRVRDPSSPVEAPPRRHFKPKPCKKCKRSFQPTGGRSLYCDYCTIHG